MNALCIKHKIAGVLGMIAMLAWHPAMAAGLDGVQVLDGFKELGGYVDSPFLLGGAWIAVKITLIAMSIGLVLGLGLALMRLSRFKALNSAAWGYIWFVRGTPQLLQLVFIFDALPLIGLRFDEVTTAVIGFALNEAAFSAELFRAGILSVNRSQSTAAAALGMGPLLTLRRIILPQSMRAVIPGLANDTHKVRIRDPARQYVHVNVSSHAGTRRFANIHSEVQAVGPVKKAQYALHLLG